MKKKPISQRGSRRQFDVLIIGGGLAGMSTALKMIELNPKVNIALVTKDQLTESNSRYAQGGIASVKLQSDSFEKHVQDTLKAGDGLCDEEVVSTIISKGPQAIEFLQSQGVEFDKEEGEFELGQEGGHSERRIYHIGDETGYSLVQTLAQKVEQAEQIKVFEYHMAVNLISQIEKHKPGARREAVGAYILNRENDLIDTFLASAVVLATGGAGKVYRYTSNPSVATGDGVALAYRVGARVGNMEFYQFHPTLLYHREFNSFLISEALRGEGAYLRSAETGERFMKHYDAKNMELATRDVVARAIFNELEHSEQKCVHLDLTHKDKEFLQKRFPVIYQTLLSVGIDMSCDMIPVVPGAHYSCGGVLTDVNGQTDLWRLFAVGETAFTGLHGANRLASNSLLEAVVTGCHAAEQCCDLLSTPVELFREVQDWDSKGVVDVRRASQINANWRGLRGEMTSYAGIVRTKSGLKVLQSLVNTRRDMIEDYYWRHVVTEDVLELRNILLVADLIVRSALARHESRGGHFREDYSVKLETAEETIFRNSREPRIKSSNRERPNE